jgi:surfactin synthase thioesterase subunit
MKISEYKHWVICPKPNNLANLRLFCFPFAGVGASFYYSWASSLSEDIELCCVQLPGRENRIREHLIASLSEIIEELTEVLQIGMNIPYAFFGHSMGAFLSFELARNLRRKKISMPTSLIVSGSAAPQLKVPKSFICDLPDNLFIKEFIKHEGTPELILKSPELMKIYLPILRADVALIESYQYNIEKALDCMISAFGGNSDKMVNQESLSAWKEQTCNIFSLHMFPGNHFYLKKEQKTLLHVLSLELKNALFSKNKTLLI